MPSCDEGYKPKSGSIISEVITARDTFTGSEVKIPTDLFASEPARKKDNTSYYVSDCSVCGGDCNYLRDDSNGRVCKAYSCSAVTSGGVSVPDPSNPGGQSTKLNYIFTSKIVFKILDIHAALGWDSCNSRYFM